MKDTYIFICNFNRLYPLQLLIHSLMSRGYKNIVILDNQSTYKPLLEWYKQCKCTVYYCKYNYGPGALDKCRFEETGFRDRYLHIIENEYHVYTDSDVVPIESISTNFINDLIEMCIKYQIPKLGLSLKIDDLPDHFLLKRQVIEHESIFFNYKLQEWIYDERCVLYRAPVDTTFAVNSPGLLCGYNEAAYRAGGNYFAKHLPWYYDTNNLPEDEKYYYENINQISHWSNLIKQTINK